MWKVLTFVCVALFCASSVSGYPVNRESETASNGSVLYVAGGVVLAVAVLVAAVFLIPLCTCCGEDLFGFREQRGRGRRESGLEPPTSSAGSPGPDHHSITIEPLPEVQQIRRTKDGKIYPKPVGFNHAVNKGVRSEDWFHGASSALEFPRSQLQYVKEVDNGWFGQVVEGEASKLSTNARKTKVIVKILRDDATTMERTYFLYEANMYRDVKHPNLLPVLGKCLDTDSYLLIFEHHPTDLKSYLVKRRGSPDQLIQNGELLRICSDISAGLAALHQRGFLHNDLACRNCLVATDGYVKIGDYGFSPQRFKEDYLLVGDTAVPIRWMAPETVETSGGRVATKETTPAANVWTFGVVLWEVLEFAKLPYMDLSVEGLLDLVIRTGSARLRQPATPVPHRDRLYELMCLCWDAPEKRPSMSRVQVLLSCIYDNRRLDDGPDFDQRWNSVFAPKPDEVHVLVQVK